MKRALALAAQAQGRTSPNPMVGAVIVADGRIIGEGYHHHAGEPHAEINALDAVAVSDRPLVRGATVYVTLEPCAHFGRTPPCADRLVAEGVAEVVVGMTDPNPAVSGKGIERLREAGIRVRCGEEEAACAALNEAYITSMTTHRPFVTLKSGMSLDGKIATVEGESKWITNEAARSDGHRLRATHDAILIGIGTVLADNPRLDYRPTDGAAAPELRPDVVILDAKGRTPTDAAILSITRRKVIIFVDADCETSRIEGLRAAGAEVVVLDAAGGMLPVGDVLDVLHAREISSVLVEGGASVVASFIEANAFDKAVVYIANRFLGGRDAVPAVGGAGIPHLADSVMLDFTSIERVGDNLRIEAYRRERKGAHVYGHH